MPHSVAPIKAAVSNKARLPLGSRQCAGHEGHKDHEEEGNNVLIRKKKGCLALRLDSL